ncbi:hypothetical protein ACFPOE_21350 [Caenimonas terrae]|uniref:Uncharacterized protein n=2 Tax=Caenimonas terrae TaxID=696074 RepID=A0ABW0NK38_9BURK
MRPNKLDMISMSLLVMTRDMPDSVKLKDSSLDYEGREQDTSGRLITGAYGSTSRQLALVAASAWTHKHQGAKAGPNRMLVLDMNYRVDNFKLTREQGRPDLIAMTGWMHMDRLQVDYRDEIKHDWLRWIAKDKGKQTAIVLEDVKLADIALRYPQYVAKMMKDHSEIMVVVHPVRLTVKPDEVLWAATVRYEPERMDTPHIRFMPDIQVIV